MEGGVVEGWRVVIGRMGGGVAGVYSWFFCIIFFLKKYFIILRIYIKFFTV